MSNQGAGRAERASPGRQRSRAARHAVVDRAPAGYEPVKKQIETALKELGVPG
jgi:hypothetical protein